jgi:amino acid adenylation domain-containing protein
MALAQKRALLAQVLRGRAEEVKTAPLSLAQERLWFVSQLLPGSFAYNIPLGIRLTGKVQPGAVQEAIAAIVARHETLRTRCRLIKGTPAQEIAPSIRVQLPVIDLRRLPEPVRYREERRLTGVLSSLSFELDRCPLWQATLVRFADEVYSFYLIIHHIIFDDWSASLFGRELKANYLAAQAGEPSSFAALPIQYADFARWQRQWVESAVVAEAVAYWKQQLAGLPTLMLPTDRPRPPVQTFFGRHEEFDFPVTRLDELKALCRRQGTTLFVALLALWKVVLAGYCAQTDVPVGSPSAGRSRQETEGLIGFFVNMMVLRTDLAGDPTFGELVARVKEVVRQALARPEVPFEKLVGELQPARDTSRNPLFQVVFVLLNVSNADYQLSGTSSRNISLAHPGAKFDLTLALSAADGVLHGILEYNTDLFERVTAKRMMESLEIGLSWMLRDPARRLAELPLMSEAARWQLVGEWNATSAPYPHEATIAELFAEVAADRPDAVAVVDGGLALTYSELSRQAGRLARALLAEGLAAEEAVGICLERGWRLVAALLGVLQAGGTYVALGPEDPPERLRLILDDCRCRRVLTQVERADALPAAAARLLLDAVPAALDGEDGAAAPPRGQADSLAYLTYTSGSTGRPKAVATPHRGVLRLVRGTDYVRWGPGEVFLQLAPVSFDAATFEIWGPLLNGGKLVVMPPGPVSLDDLEGQLARHQVTTLWLTAGLFHRMVDDRLAGLAGLRQLVAGGDALSLPHVLKMVRELPAVALVDGYGPTESTTFACCARLDASLAAAAAVPIGRPIGNTRVHVVDRELRLLPLGAVGELCIAGDGLARGYFGRGDLTAARFVPDRYGEPGSRLYRTGDLVRRQLDGSVQFLGRMDNQVKVRGFRIELGEVEAALLDHPAVREAVVVARAERGEKRLVAYAVFAGEEPAAEALRAFLRQRLPDYMVPALFMALPALPLTANGKVDRRRLPAPEERRPELGVGFVAPGDGLESTVAKIWQEVLGVDRVGVDDNFFDLGGSSLLIVQAHQKLQAALGREIPILLLFNHPNVRSLAARLSDQGGAARAAEGGLARQVALAKERLRRRVPRQAARRPPEEDRT